MSQRDTKDTENVVARERSDRSNPLSAVKRLLRYTRNDKKGYFQVKDNNKNTVLVSGCIVGLHCRYNGSTDIKEDIMQRLKEINFVPLCPEQLGGLPTPRPRAWISFGNGSDVLSGCSSVITEDGKDVTDNYIRGAKEVEIVVKLLGIKLAYMKNKSPSCGFGKIWQGDTLVDGNGVCAALLAQNNVEIIPV